MEHMTLLFESILQNILLIVDPLLQYDEDGYPIEEELEEYESVDDDLDALYDDDLLLEDEELN